MSGEIAREVGEAFDGGELMAFVFPSDDEASGGSLRKM
jgi:hypothetical protein